MMLYFIGLIIYTALIILLVFRLSRSIKRRKYESIRPEILTPPSLKQRIIWGLALLQLALTFLMFLAGGNILAIYIQKDLLIGDNKLYMATNGIYNFSNAWIFLDLLLTVSIFKLFHHKAYDYVMEYKYQLSRIVEKLFIPLIFIELIVFIIAFPTCILGIGDYLYFSESYIGVDRFWSISEMHYSYEDVNSVQVSYYKPVSIKDGYEFYYDIYFDENTSEDIFMDRSNNVVKADEILRSKEVEIEREIIKRKDYEDIKASYNENFVNKIENIFIIDN